MVWFDWCVLNHVLPFDSNHSKCFIVSHPSLLSVLPSLIPLLPSPMPSNTLKQVTEKGLLVLGHGDAIFGEETYYPLRGTRGPPKPLPGPCSGGAPYSSAAIRRSTLLPASFLGELIQ